MKKSILLLILLLGIVTPAFSADHYFDATDGSDSGAGTSGDPWQTISKAETECTSGDTCYFASEETWQASSAPLLDTAAGTIYDGSTYGAGTRAKFEMTSTGSTGDAVIRIHASTVTIQGLEVDMGGYNYSGISTYGTGTISTIVIDDCRVHSSLMGADQWNYGIYLGATNSGVTVSDVTVEDTHVYNTGHETIALYPSDNAGGARTLSNVTIKNCTVYNFGNDGSTWGDGIYITNDVDTAVIEGNTVYHGGSSSNGINISCKNSTTCPDNIIVRRNTISDITNTGITVFGHNNTPSTLIGTYDIYNNFVYDSGLSDLNVQGYIDATAKINFMNNTVYRSVDSDNSGAGALRIYDVSATSGTPIYLANNILWSGADALIFTRYANDTSRLSHENNHYYLTTGSIWVKLADGATTYNQTTTASTWEATAQNTDPAFTDAGNSVNIGVTSDAIDNGADLSATFTDDFYEKARDASFDIGAYEYGVPSLLIIMKGVTL